MQESSDTGITSSEINLEDDYQLIESTNIINDYIELNKKFALSSIK